MVDPKAILRLLFLLLLASPLPAVATDLVPATKAEMTIVGAPGDQIGSVVETGDFNCDGAVDLIFSAPGNLLGPIEKSGGATVYILFGRFSPFDGRIDLDNSNPDVEILGPPNYGTFGARLEVADIDGDGCDDVLVADTAAEPNGWLYAGRVSVLFGRSDPPAKWLVDWDTRSPDLVFFDEIYFNMMGEAMAVGDFDGDEQIDLAISGQSLVDAGTIYLVKGPIEKSEGVVRNFAVDPPDLKIVGAGDPGSWEGASYTVGDLNIDGKADLIVGLASEFSILDHGTTLVIFGRSIGAVPVQRDLETDPPDILFSTSEAQQFREFGRWAQVVNHAGGAAPDLWIGDPGYAPGVFASGALTLFQQPGDLAGTVVELAEQNPDLMILGTGWGWQFFDRFYVVETGNTVSIWGGAPSASVEQLAFNGAVYRLDLNLPLESEAIIDLGETEPSTIYHGTGVADSFGLSMLIADLEKDRKPELIVGSDGSDLSSRTGAIHIFFDQIKVATEYGDDDDDDDDSQEGPFDGLDVNDPDLDFEIVPDSEGGCRCG
jgi:hypothetical protein